MKNSLVLPNPARKTFIDDQTMYLSALLTRGWIRYLMKELDCAIGQLDEVFPTPGQAISKLEPPEPSKRWYRWARAGSYPKSAKTLIDTREVLVTEHAEMCAPGSMRVLDCPLKLLITTDLNFSHDTVTKILMMLPPHLAQEFLMCPLPWDPEGDSRVDPNADQIALLSRNPSIEALAGAIGIYMELQRGLRTWACIGANQYLHVLIDEVASDAWWLGEDARFLRGSVFQILRSPAAY